MAHFRISKGLRLPAKGFPDQVIDNSAVTRRAALSGTDMPGLRPALEVEVGDRIRVGDIVFRDRHRPETAFAAPVSGRVSAIEFGPRRTLSALIIEADADTDTGIAKPSPGLATTANPTAIREALLACGLWPAFRTRPFGTIPAPQARPHAIVVNAVSGSALAPDPRVVITMRPGAFESGLAALTNLTQGSVYLCHDPGAVLIDRLPEGVEGAIFSGTAAAGLAGTQINRLCPAGPRRQVWSVGYQDVIAIGHLLETGAYLAERIISVAGPRATRPRMIQSVLGADLRALATTEATTDPAAACTILSGDTLTGRAADFLGRYHDQVMLTDPVHPAGQTNGLHSRLVQRSALTPLRSLERAIAIDVLAVPLMRALSLGDAEAAERLGCLELIEEDVAALSLLCTSGADYGHLLREVLDQLAEEAA